MNIGRTLTQLMVGVCVILAIGCNANLPTTDAPIPPTRAERIALAASEIYETTEFERFQVAVRDRPDGSRSVIIWELPGKPEAYIQFLVQSDGTVEQLETD